MKRFTTEDTNDQEGPGLIPAQRRAEEVPPLGLSFEGGVGGARRLSRRQAIGVLGGSLAGVSLLSLGLAASAKGCHLTCPPGFPKAHVRGPDNLHVPRLSVARQGTLNWFEFTLEWTIIFDSQVVRHTFRTNWVLKEEDTSDDDIINATVEPHVHSAWSHWKVFAPVQANPSRPEEVRFKETIIWHRDDLDTELGGEELYAWVGVADMTANSEFVGQQSTQAPLSP